MSERIDWLNLISKRAAINEQFPPLSKVLRERPGSATDTRRQRLIAEENQMSKAREDIARWQASVDRNARHQEELATERRRRAYNAYQAEKHREKDIA